MKTTRFTTDQIIGVLKEAEGGMPPKELCRKYGMSEATLYNWKAKYSGMGVSEARRLKELEDENRRLKKLVADQALDIQMLKEITTKKW
jgi:putative transposase